MGKIMKWQICLVFLVTLLLYLPSLNAISLSGKKVGTIIFEPGLIINNDYIVGGTNNEFGIYVGGDFEEYITLSEMVNNKFTLSINFPEYFEPGIYYFGLRAAELPSSGGGGVNTLTSVSKNFKVEVYTFGKDIAVSLNAPSVNEGTPVNFQISVDSIGYSDIDSIKAEITVYDAQNRTLDVLKTEEKTLNSLASKTLTASLDTTNLEAAAYKAKAVVFYDGEQKNAEDTFRVGEVDLLLESYTKEVEQGFSEFDITVANNWGNKLENVYAKLFLTEEEIFQTQTIFLEPWEGETLTTIAKIEQEPGEYAGVIQLFFEGEMKEEPIILTVVKTTSSEEFSEELETSEVDIVTISLILTIIIIFIVLVIVLLKYRKNKKGSKKKTKDEF